jgi:hypothetical protein
MSSRSAQTIIWMQETLEALREEVVLLSLVEKNSFRLIVLQGLEVRLEEMGVCVERLVRQDRLQPIREEQP